MTRADKRAETVRPTTKLPPVPTSLDELLDPRWMSAALGVCYPGVVVTGITAVEVFTRLSTICRFLIDCDGGRPVGLSPALVAKGYFSETSQAIPNPGQQEARFYATVAPRSGVRTLRCVYADVDSATHHGVILTEDLSVAGGTFLNACSSFSVDQTAASLEELARLHASAWGEHGEPDDWLASRLRTYQGVRGIDHARQNFEGPRSVFIDPAVRDPRRLMHALDALAERDSGGDGWTIVHGDAHIGNVFLDRRGRPGLLDWQVVQRGHWSIDVGYHVAAALEVDERRRHERDLLAHYLGCLRSFGVSAPDWDQAWRDFGAAFAYGLYMWGVTVLEPPERIERMLHRQSAAAADHDSFYLLGV
jgi:hypothetical protein